MVYSYSLSMSNSGLYVKYLTATLDTPQFITISAIILRQLRHAAEREYDISVGKNQSEGHCIHDNTITGQ